MNLSDITEAERKALRDAPMPEPEKLYRLDSITAGNVFLVDNEDEVRWTFDSKLWFSYLKNAGIWIEGDEPVHQRGKLVVENVYEVAKAFWIRSWKLTDSNDPEAIAALLALIPDLDIEEEAKACKKQAAALTAFGKQLADGGFERMLKRASTDPAICLKQDGFNPHRDTLTTPGGVVSLRTGVVSPLAPHWLATKRTKGSVGIDWRGGQWDEFLQWVQPQDEERLALQRAVGCSLLGTSKEKAAFFPYGKPDTGKTLFVEAVSHALGDYADYVSVDAFRAGSSGSDKYGLADVPGLRYIVSSEFDQDMNVNQTLLKQLTGGELVPTRQIYSRPFKFQPQGKLWIPTNNLPWLGGDEGSWVRMVVIPFLVSVEGHQFSWELGDERPGALADLFQTPAVSSQILSWAVEGSAAYIARGLDVPKSWVASVEDAKEEQVPAVEVWIQENLEQRTDGLYTSASMLYEDYCNALPTKVTPASQTAFGRALRRVGFAKRPPETLWSERWAWGGVGSKAGGRGQPVAKRHVPTPVADSAGPVATSATGCD